MMDMIEKAARAICKRRYSIPWDDASRVSRESCMADARAAFEAAREPTDAMLDAFVARALQVNFWSESGGWTGYGRAQWKTMIDAALCGRSE